MRLRPSLQRVGPDSEKTRCHRLAAMEMTLRKMPPERYELSGETTPPPQTSQSVQVTPGAPIKKKDDKRLKAKMEPMTLTIKDVVENTKADKTNADKMLSEAMKKHKLVVEE